jgi:hypothetical protein
MTAARITTTTGQMATSAHRIMLFVDILPHFEPIVAFHPFKKIGKHFSLYEETQSKFLTLKILNV